MSRFRKAAILAVLTALLGVAAGLIHSGFGLEESSGLDLLFNLRGQLPPPPQVVVISEDTVSADRLNLSRDPMLWPRSYHARLINKLVREGASVIAFDHFFGETRSPDEDRILAKAVRDAGNVVLIGDLRTQNLPLKDPSGHVVSRMTVEKLTPPAPMLARAAASFAPFLLPKVPVTVSQYWTFKKSLDVPTLPAAALQIFSLQSFDKLVDLLKKALRNPAMAQANDPRDRIAAAAARRLVQLNKDSINGFDAINEFSRSMKVIFGNDTLLAGTVMHDLDKTAFSATESRNNAVLKSLLKMYEGGDSHYLNFYGPAQSITTVPYADALLSSDPVALNGKSVDFNGKAVFIGESNSITQRVGDTYHTVFSRPDGLDLSGVEIAATAFANLLEDDPIKPLGLGAYTTTLALFGGAFGLICFLLGPIAAVLCTLSVIALYLGAAYSLFVMRGVWLPVIVPAVIQAPVAFTAALLWKYIDARKIEMAHEQLKEVDRLKTLFLSQVSHELKTPLSSIKGFVDNMLDGLTGELQGKQRDYLDRVRANTERLTRMITNLLDLSRIESRTQRLDRLPQHIFYLAEEALNQFQLIAAAKHVTLDLVCPDPKLEVMADHDKFIQVITNLIDNAIKFTPAGGKVTVSVKRHDPEHVMLSVKDTGVGIPDDVIKKHLFHPFYQAKQLPGTHVTGLGLGLSIVKTLVELHDGWIAVTSEVGKGTEFSIVMPALNKDAEAPGRTDTAARRHEPPAHNATANEQGAEGFQHYAIYKTERLDM